MNFFLFEMDVPTLFFSSSAIDFMFDFLVKVS